MVVTAEVRSIHHKNHLIKKEKTVLKKTQSIETIQLITLISYQRPQMISREKQSTPNGKRPKGKTPTCVKGRRMKMRTDSRVPTKTLSLARPRRLVTRLPRYTPMYPNNQQVRAPKRSMSQAVHRSKI